MRYFKNVLILTIILFTFSCDDISKISEEIKNLKNNQNLMMQKQSELLKKLTVVETKIGKENTAVVSGFLFSSSTGNPASVMNKVNGSFLSARTVLM